MSLSKQPAIHAEELSTDKRRKKTPRWRENCRWPSCWWMRALIEDAVEETDVGVAMGELRRGMRMLWRLLHVWQDCKFSQKFPRQQRTSSNSCRFIVGRVEHSGLATPHLRQQMYNLHINTDTHDINIMTQICWYLMQYTLLQLNIRQARERTVEFYAKYSSDAYKNMPRETHDILWCR